ncbi:MAG: MucB/RseB C-terminal domain-containing protein [Pseudomonadales bacterium]
MLLRLLLLPLLLLSISVEAASPRELLDQMSRAFREQNYQGFFTYEYSGEMQSMQIIHAVQDGVEFERLIYLNGEPREVIRRGHELSCIHPGDQILRLGHTISSGPFARTFLEPLSDLEDNYDLSMGEVKRIANRSAQQIRVRPKDTYRNGFWLYLDTESHLLLKSVIVSPEGRPLERFQFATVEVGGSISEEDLQPGEGVSYPAAHQVISKTDASEQKDILGDFDMHVGWLPPGFTLAARSDDKRDGEAVRLALYTDGLATISVFVEPSAEVKGQSVEGRARHGATVVYTRQINAGGKGWLVTVVGEVPLFTAARVARYVEAKKAAG